MILGVKSLIKLQYRFIENCISSHMLYFASLLPKSSSSKLLSKYFFVSLLLYLFTDVVTVAMAITIISTTTVIQTNVSIYFIRFIFPSRYVLNSLLPGGATSNFTVPLSPSILYVSLNIGVLICGSLCISTIFSLGKFTV